MKKFIKENWFKLGILLMLLILVLIYLLLLKPEQENKKYLLNNIKCQQDGFKLYEQDKKELINNQSLNSAPKFRFIKELNTCIYNGVLYEETPVAYSSYYFIKDVYTNIEIAYRSEYRKKDGGDLININEPLFYNDLYYKYFLEE